MKLKKKSFILVTPTPYQTARKINHHHIAWLNQKQTT